MTDSKPLIVVTGATGLQGGSVVDYLLSDPERSFRVRATTRNVESAKAKGVSRQCWLSTVVAENICSPCGARS